MSNKNLYWLFRDRNYSKIFNSKNTILIDDNPYNNVIIPLNNIYIPKYCCKDNDSFLFDLYLWLKKYKNTKNIQKTEKITFHNDIITYNCKLPNSELKKTKNLKIGDYIQYEINNDNKLNGYIEKKNKRNTFDIIEYNQHEENGELKIHKNIKIENIRKYVFN